MKTNCLRLRRPHIMNNKLITVAAIALTSVLSATSASAHVSNGGLVSGNGTVVKSSYTDCIRVSSGVKSEACGHVKAAAPVKAAPAPKAVSQAVSLSGDANFATNSAELKDAGKAALNTFATRAKALNVSGSSPKFLYFEVPTTTLKLSNKLP